MTFHNDPPAADLIRPMPLIRPQAKKPLNTIVLSERWVGVYTHWWGGKTIRHHEDGCKACDRNIAKLWKGFMPVCDGFRPDTIALLQFTGRCCRTLNEYMSRPKCLVGARVLWTRIGRANNSPLRCEIMGWAEPKTIYTYQRTCEIVDAIFRDNGEFQEKA